MPRPCKRRRICAIPGCERFGPKDDSALLRQTIVMTLDEFETIRLIDWVGMTQEQCATQMNVARTTAQAIYNAARRKLAECLIHQKDLQIAGGDYVLCEGNALQYRGSCPCNHHCRRGKQTEAKEM